MGIPPTVQPLWDALQREVIWAHAYWINYRQLFGKSKERVDLLNNCAGEFFFIVQDALLTDVQLSLSRLADRPTTSGQENATIERLSNEIAALNTSQLSTDLTGLLQRYRDRCEKIKQRRHKQIAHADLGALLQQHGSTAANLPEPSRQEIEDALEVLRDFMNAVDAHFTTSHMGYEHFKSRNDGESLVWTLKKGLRYDELRKAQELPFDDLKKFSRYDA
jgi:hypothetical protein